MLAHKMKRVSGIDAILSSSDSPMATRQNLAALRVLVVGAGGLGCELLKNLALLGFRQIDVIDMDTIDVTNLNRQFLFSESDVGKAKASVAAEFVNKRVPGVKVVPHVSAIQDMSDDFYEKFNIVICGLDSVEARRWINAKIVGLVDDNDPTTIRPLIDGGTEGLRGQVRVILPTITACYECSLDMIAPQKTYPLCTIAATPRLPEHCIEWALVVGWPQWHSELFDADRPDHMQEMYERALERAEEHCISGVTLSLTQGVVKHIIPAIASTNAIVASACCTEAFKLATAIAPPLDNYMTYAGNDGAHAYPFSLDARPDCPVCGGEALRVDLAKSATLSDLLESIAVQAPKASISAASGPLYMRNPPVLEKATRANLTKPLSELFESGSELVVTDATLPFSLRVTVRFSQDDHR